VSRAVFVAIADPDLRRLIALLLADSAQVTLATHAGSARAHADDRLYDVVILDWTRSGYPGVTLAQEIRARQPGTPILTLCAWGEVPPPIDGAHALLLTPFDIDAFDRTVDALCRRRPGGAPSAAT
jgi:DNA-binding response OmpR family regulator